MADTDNMNVVLNFHKGDQISAKLFLELLMYLDEGIDCTYYLQYGDHPATIRIQETLLRFMNKKKVHFSNMLPRVTIPIDIVQNDPNLIRQEGNHTVRSKAQKFKHLQWNLCVYKYISILDSFIVTEPDSVILKDGWLKDIYCGYKMSDSPIFGHVKRGKILGQLIPTHWAGTSVYNGLSLRKLPLERYFVERYDNPWWPYRNEPDTTPANNCFWGPAFSGYDISYDYFLFGLYWRDVTGLNDPFQWPLAELQNRQDLIFCDFNTKMKTDDIMAKYADKLPIMHGIKSDEVRERSLNYFLNSNRETLIDLPLSGPPNSPLPKDNSKFITISDLDRLLHGERCFIIGNGPSLRETDLRHLKNEYTIGLNRIYLNFDNMEFQPTICCVVNPNVIEQFGVDIDKVNSIKFIRKDSSAFIKNLWNTFFVDSLMGIDFNKQFESLGWYEGWTVTYCAMQVAYFLGFKEVILVGVDHNFVKSGEPNKLVTSDGADPNHFHPNYFGKGVKWQYPDLERSEQAYKIAKKVFEDDGRRIVDATVKGKLQVFDKVDYLSLFQSANHEMRVHDGAPMMGDGLDIQIAASIEPGIMPQGRQAIQLKPDGSSYSDRLIQLQRWLKELRTTIGEK